MLEARCRLGRLARPRHRKVVCTSREETGQEIHVATEETTLYSSQIAPGWQGTTTR